MKHHVVPSYPQVFPVSIDPALLGAKP